MDDKDCIKLRGAGRTLIEWLKDGYVPKKGHAGEFRYSSKIAFRKGKPMIIYYDPIDVQKNDLAAKDQLLQIKQKERPDINYCGKLLSIWVKSGFIPKDDCFGHLRYKFPTCNHFSDKYLFFDPEEVCQGSIDDSSHAKKVWEREQNRRWNTTGKTLEQWAKMGFVPNGDEKPTRRYNNFFSYLYGGTVCSYFDADQVIEDRVKAINVLEQIKRERNDRNKAVRKKKKEEILLVRKEWEKEIGGGKIVIFDTETSGLDADINDILSLSWQVTDSDFNVIKSVTRYFEWPEDKDRVEQEAICVNGLTQERLAELGTVERKEAIEEFMFDVKQANLLVAHNLLFDYNFVFTTACRYNISVSHLEGSKLFCTMRGLTEYCRLKRPGFDGYKWPRLSEAAEKLRVKKDDIEWHRSDYDTEIVRRIMVQILRRGIVEPLLL